MIAFVLIARLLLSAAFLMSALTKLPVPGEFVANVQKYHILPRPVATAYGFLIPYVELGAGIMLLLGVFTTWAALAVIVILLTFMAAVGTAMVRGQQIECRCFGLLYRERVGWGTQVRDGILLALSISVLVADDGTLGIRSLVANVGRPGYVLALIATLVVLSVSLFTGYVSLKEQKSHRR